nr:immunoglobulin heavy chain junction region [Macaca mulatta]MOV54879.1 immunoglobulin heavy chain junction region [Macaca mulatta]MOV55634.1 immunoglobulin heavy chain junction region [Macaca mulatta]MOV57114.1 immunoglobulin heavy chain junction region [Macaca mulatta]MOV57471.1 immunoglobulin heavy chain junction region [Macaca mulatta]
CARLYEDDYGYYYSGRGKNSLDVW